MKKLSLMALFVLVLTGKAFGRADSLMADTDKFNPEVERFFQKGPSKAGISYEALSKFVQAGVTTENNGGFTFKSTLFGTANFFKHGKLDLSDYYNSKLGKFQRNFEYQLGVSKDNSGSYNIFNGGFKYAIVNRRDSSDFNFFNILVSGLKAIGNFQEKALKIYKDKITGDPALVQELVAGINKYRDSNNLMDLPKGLLAVRDSLSALMLHRDESAFLDSLQQVYNAKVKALNSRGLATLGINSRYRSNTGKIDSLNISFEYLVGLGKNHNKAWNVDLQLNNIFLQDSISKRGLSRNISRASLGINKVLINDKSGGGSPLFEFELACEDIWLDHGQTYANEARNTVNANAIFRVHFSKSMSLPVTLKYDVKHPKLFGFLSIQWNLDDNSTTNK